MLLTKHQQAKYLWPQKQADALLTKHQQAKPLWPQTQGKAAAENRTLKLGKITVAHNSNQREIISYINIFELSIASSSFGSTTANVVSTQ